MSLAPELNALLGGLSRLQGPGAAAQLAARAEALRRTAGTGQHAAQLLHAGSIRSAGEHLAAIAATLKAAWGSGRVGSQAARAAFEQQLHAACLAAEGCLVLAPAVLRLPADAVAASRSVELLLGPGTLLLAEYACGRFTSTPAAAATGLAAQALLWHSALVCSERTGAHEPFASQVAQPEPVAAWLAAAAGAANALAELEQQGVLTVDHLMFLAPLSAALPDLLLGPPYACHAAAVQQDARLAAALLAAMQSALRVASVSLALPPRRRPEGHGLFTWQMATRVCAALSSRPLMQALQASAAAAGATAGGLSSSALQQAGAACQLLACMPLGHDQCEVSEVHHSLLLCAVAMVLGIHAKAVFRGIISLQLSDSWCCGEQARQLARQLLQAAQRLPQLLQLAAARPLQGIDVARLCCGGGCAVDLLGQLARTSEPAPGRAGDGLIRSPAEVTLWCSTGSAALRSLAGAAALRQQASQDGAAEATAALAVSVASMADDLGDCLKCMLAHCTWTLNSCPGSSAEAEAALTALWQLNSTACRAVHWAAAGHGAQLPGLQALLFVPAVTASLFCAWRLRICCAAQEYPNRCLAAMGAATCRALQTIAADLGQAEQLVSDAAKCAGTAMALAVAAAGCPVAVFGQHCLLELMRRAEQGVPQDSELRDFVSSIVLEAAISSPRLAALMLDCGMMAAVLRRLRAACAIAPSGEATGDSKDAGDLAVRLAGALVVLLRERTRVGRSLEDGPVLDRMLQPLEAFVGHLRRDNALSSAAVQALLQDLPPEALPLIQRLAVTGLREHWRRPEQQQEDALALAQAAAARSCAYLRCSNVAGEGGPAAGQGAGSSKCSACRVAWYCSEACSHADWRGPGGHRRACKALAAVRAQQRGAAGEQQQAAAGAQQGRS